VAEVGLIIAIPTKNRRGLEDEVYELFARAPYFTIIELSEAQPPQLKEILENRYKDLLHGVGPLVLKTLKDKGVTTILLPEAGIGVKQLAKELDIHQIEVKPGIKVRDALKEAHQHPT